MRLRFGLSLVLLIGSALLAFAAPEAPDPRERVNTEAVLVDYQSKDQISQFVGIAPVRCVASSRTTELCEWRLSNRERRWKDLARAIRTSDRVALLCELPSSGGQRRADACTAHAQRSNRDQFQLGSQRAGKQRQLTSAQLAKRRDEYQATARAWFSEALTLTEMSRLMGATPENCADLDGGWARCSWSATGRVYGHGTAAMLIRAPLSKKIRVTCVFPKSGGPRDEECAAEVGA